MAELRKFLKVLVVVDGSEYSMNGAEYAVSIAKQFGSQLIVLHVITSDIISPQLEEIKKNAEEYFEKIRLIDPIIKLLNSRSSDTLRQSLIKYTVVALISSLILEARRTVEENESDTRPLFEGKISFTVDYSHQWVKENVLTKGNIIASKFCFHKSRRYKLVLF